MPEADAAKRSIHVTRWGTTGPAVLVARGGVQGRGPGTFAKREALAQQGWRLQLVDRPGFGQSPSHGVDDMEADSVWIAGMLGDGANLIGHSWGGAEALLAAARRPGAVRPLVLVEPALQSLFIGAPGVEKDPALKVAARAHVPVLVITGGWSPFLDAVGATVAGLTGRQWRAAHPEVASAAAVCCSLV